jgi:hypothetical protein
MKHYLEVRDNKMAMMRTFGVLYTKFKVRGTWFIGKY